MPILAVDNLKLPHPGNLTVILVSETQRIPFLQGCDAARQFLCHGHLLLTKKGSFLSGERFADWPNWGIL